MYSMYTAIRHTWNLNIKASSLQLDTRSTEKRSYEYNKFLLDRYQYFHNLRQSSYIVSSLHHLCLLNEFPETRQSTS